MKCIFCDTDFYAQTMAEPAEPCDCGRCCSQEDAREDYFRDREPTQDELEDRRHGRDGTGEP